MWSINIVKLLLFVLLNFVDELYTYYYWMWISPLLFECCLYVGNVQITRFSCCRELTLSRVVLGSLWYVTRWRYCIVFHVLCIIMIYLDEPFENGILISCLCRGCAILLNNWNVFPLQCNLNCWQEMFE